MTKARNLSLLSAVEAGATADQTKADIDALGINGANKNWIINGDFQISQRGSYTSATALTTSSVFHLDRFKSKHNNISGTLTHKLAQTVDGKVTNTMLLTATAGSNGRVESVQRIEATKPFVSQTITFSAWVKSNSASSRIIIHQNGANIQTSSNQHTGGGAFELLKGTVTCAANSGDLYLYAGIQAAGTGNVAIANGHYFEMAFVQVEHGSVDTDFENRTYAESLLACQRYYAKNAAAIGVWVTTTTFRICGQFNTTMRANPSISRTSNAGYHEVWNLVAINGFSTGSHYGNSKGFDVACSSSGTVSSANVREFALMSPDCIQFNSEL